MNHTSLQITIRGLDPATKEALVKQANKQGVSLNQYALKSLQQSAGVDEREQRYQAMRQFLNTHHMEQADKQALDEAIAWSDSTSTEKQRAE
jgi:ribosomal protein L12E/L44/L45/RPP1/RPP2